MGSPVPTQRTCRAGACHLPRIAPSLTTHAANASVTQQRRGVDARPTAPNQWFSARVMRDDLLAISVACRRSHATLRAEVRRTNGTWFSLGPLRISRLASCLGFIRRSNGLGLRLFWRGSYRSGRSATRWTAMVGLRWRLNCSGMAMTIRERILAVYRGETPDVLRTVILSNRRMRSDEVTTCQES